MRNQSGAAAGLRVFISSTFRDLQPERDALVAQAFPRLRAAAERGGHGLQEVDLRWGMPAKKSEIFQRRSW
jgi:hypothetical protein